MINEIVMYRPNELAEHIEVRLIENTVWLNQEQLSRLFHRDQSVISRHIRNVFKEGELDEKSNMQKMHIPDSDKPVAYFNLDVIISVGYRVKSKQGTQFRIWATNVLRDYLLKGYVINQRVDSLENKFKNLSQEVKQLSLQLKTQEMTNHGVFFEGQIFDAYVFVSQIVKSAKSDIILIDNYVDETVLTLLTKRKKNVSATIFTKQISKQLQLDVEKHNSQYPKIELKSFSLSHDRFLIIDQTDLYHMGASLKDLGKKWFAFSLMNSFTADVLEKLKYVHQ
jgi:hypothetical protein